MKTINKYISTLKSTIDSLNGDITVAEEYESQILLEFEDFKFKKQFNDTILAENQFVEGLEDPKLLATSLLGLSQTKNSIIKINLFSKDDWVIIANIYIFFYIGWFLFKLVSSLIFISANYSLIDYKDFTVPFGYAAILSLYFWPFLYFFYLLVIKNVSLNEFNGKHIIMEIIFLVFQAVIGHYILVDIHNHLMVQVITLAGFALYIIIPLLVVFIFSFILIRILVHDKYNRSIILLFIPFLLFLFMLFSSF